MTIEAKVILVFTIVFDVLIIGLTLVNALYKPHRRVLPIRHGPSRSGSGKSGASAPGAGRCGCCTSGC